MLFLRKVLTLRFDASSFMIFCEKKKVNMF